MFCKNCGKELQDDVKFCPVCGAEQPNVAMSAVDSENGEEMIGKTVNSKAVKTGLLVGVLCLGICLVLVLVLMNLTPSAKSEKDILADIEANDEMFLQNTMVVQSAEITQRQTNKEDKTDYVWLELTASTDEFTYYAEYELTYALYNDGWSLDNIEKYNTDMMPLVGSDWSDNQILETMLNFGYDLSSMVVYDHTTDLAGKKDNYSFTAEEVHNYMTEEFDITLTLDYCFGEWGVASDPAYIINDSTEQWYINGDWVLDVDNWSGNYTRKITINSFDGKNLDASWNYIWWGWGVDRDTPRTSADGSGIYACEEWDHCRSTSLSDEFGKIYIYKDDGLFRNTANSSDHYRFQRVE